MATSSIFANVVIRNEEAAKTIAHAFEDFEVNGMPRKMTREKPVMEAKDIKAFFSKGGAQH